MYLSMALAAAGIVQLKPTDFMAEPITTDLASNQDDMKTKMELLILRIQVKIFHYL